MKIYIKNYNPTDIFKKIKLLDDYYVNSKKSIEIISDEGVFYINDTKIYKMSIISDKLSELKSNNIELLLDKTLYNNIVVHQLPLNHITNNITRFYYSTNPKSKIKLIVEGEYGENINETEKRKIIENKYYNFSPTNFYFEVQNEIKDFELLNNDDLNVFLSLLN